MMSREIERLLGGYATKTLTEAERKTLFEAALEDPDVFAALQAEEPLRDLLADDESRREIGLALRRPPEKTKPIWFASPWALGLAGTAAAACVLFIFFARQPRPTLQSVAREPAMLRAPAPVTASDEIVLQPKLKASRPPKRSPAAPPVQITAAAPPPAAVPSGSALARYAPPAQEPSVPLPFQVLRAGTELGPSDTIQEGDAVQIRVRPVSAGVLQLLKRTAAGTLQPLGPGIAAEPNQTYVLPEMPILVHGEQSFRLIVVQREPPVFADFALTPGRPVRTQK